MVREPGWTVLQPATSTPDDDQPKDADSDDSQQLPTLAQDQLVPKLNAELKSGKTTAPKPYNDSSLLTAMKSAGQDLDDQDLAAYMKQSGLGTPATRAAIIEKLFASGYAERKKKIIQPTPKGVAFIQQVHPKLKDVALTASWEKQLKDIEDGSLTPQAADASFLSFVRQLFPEITAAPPAPIPEDAKDSFGPCPKCKDGSVRKTKLGAGCSRYKAGCTFTIWGEQHHKKLSDSHFRDLVSKRRTSLIKGFQNKDKSKTFDAFLVLTDDFKVQLEFQNDQKKGKP